jgi:predicted nucleic acid-binding Zn ribbon protein
MIYGEQTNINHLREATLSVSEERARAEVVMDQIKDILQQVVKNISEHKVPEVDNLQSTWEHAVGKKTAQHTHIVGTKKGTLLVLADSPVRIFDLTLHKARILKQLQEQLPEILEISFKIGKVT